MIMSLIFQIIGYKAFQQFTKIIIHVRMFIRLMGAILRMRNILVSFDDFEGKEIISERDFQDYLGRYQDIYDIWKTHPPKSLTNIENDIVFEIELIKQIEINIDYILMLVAKYHDSHCKDKEVLITIQRAVDSSPELRSKKDLIENFIAGINDVDDVINEWHSYVAEEREKALQTIIDEEKLKSEETRQFISGAFRDGGTVTANIRVRSKEFAVLKSVGMTSTALKKMLYSESMYCTMQASVKGGSFGILIPFLINLSLRNALPVRFHLPLCAAILSIGITFFVVLAITYIEIKKIKGQSLIETIRMDSIR